MSTHQFLINPGPAATPGSNLHRAGASNHLKGSGEIPMVDTYDPRANCLCGHPVDPVAGTVAERINRGDLDLSDPWSLPEVVTSLVTEIVAEQTAALRVELASVTAELDAANDAVTELIGQVDEARADAFRAETALETAARECRTTGDVAADQLELDLWVADTSSGGGV